MFEQWTLKKRLTMTFAAILLLAGMLIGVALTNNAKLRDTLTWNTHTHKVLSESDSMLLNMVNIETGLRGFVAGGHEKFLEPFNAGEQAFGVAFDKAKALTADNPAQQGRLDKVQANHRQFMAVANTLVTLRRDATAGKVTQDDLLREFGAGKDKAAMDAFRAGIAAFAKEESDLLVLRSAALDSTMSATTYTLLLGGMGIGFLAGKPGYSEVAPLFDAPFKGVLTLFLLEIGLVTGRHLGDLPPGKPRVVRVGADAGARRHQDPAAARQL